MRGLPGVWTLLLFSTVVASCASYRLTLPHEGKEQETPYAITKHVLFGALALPERPTIAEKCDEDDGIYDVTVRDHLGFDLVSVLTLGIWQPIRIEYRCNVGFVETDEGARL